MQTNAMPTEIESTADAQLDGEYARIVKALQGLRFGAVEIQVHDYRIVRITRSEKLLIEREPTGGPQQKLRR
jgi:hypothetical protein